MFRIIEEMEDVHAVESGSRPMHHVIVNSTKKTKGRTVARIVSLRTAMMRRIMHS